MQKNSNYANKNDSLAQIFAQLQDGFRQNEGGNYSGAFALVDDARQKLDEIANPAPKAAEAQSAASEKIAAPAPKKQNSPEREAYMKEGLANASLALDGIKKTSLEMWQEPGFAPIEALLNSSSALANAGLYDDANKSLQSANAQIEIMQKSLAKTGAQILDAKKAIGEAYSYANESGLLVLGANSSVAGKKLDEAQRIVYQNPQKAYELALSALEDARQAKKESANLSSAATATVGMVFGIVAIAAIALLLINKRKDIENAVDEIGQGKGRKKGKR